MVCWCKLQTYSFSVHKTRMLLKILKIDNKMYSAILPTYIIISRVNRCMLLSHHVSSIIDSGQIVTIQSQSFIIASILTKTNKFTNSYIVRPVKMCKRVPTNMFPLFYNDFASIWYAFKHKRYA